jgi:hypothetical protein
MTVDDIRKLHAETTTGLPGRTFPRWGKFDRDCVGVLLAEIDRLLAGRFTPEELQNLCQLFGKCRTDEEIST